MRTQSSHTPVLLKEVIQALNIKADGTYLDATYGRGGHSEAITKKIDQSGRLIALDRDPEAITQGESKFANDTRVQFIHTEFAAMQQALLDTAGISKVDGVLMDLGVSSPQLDQAERGFSFLRDGSLDMRMDITQGESAAQWLANVEESDLVKVLFDFGEEKYARRIARAIVVERDTSAITSTLQLADLIEHSIPKKEKHKHPATRTFQAIRLQVNQELYQISTALPQAVALLNEGGRLAVISFHSLEDRIVKRFLRDLATPTLPPKHIPVTPEAYQTPLTLVSKAIKPTNSEIEINPRSRSSVLRVAQRTNIPYRMDGSQQGGRNAR